MSESGSILLDGDVIRYRSEVYGDWDLPLSSVRIIGESTNQSGPFADDWFFCFATGPDGWLEASAYAEGHEKFLGILREKLGVSIECGLCSSTDFASRVLWPESLAGEPMFRFEAIPPKGLWGMLFGSSENRQTYSERVLAELTGKQ